MSGRVAAVCRPPGLRPRARAARAPLRRGQPVASFGINLLTLTAEIAGVAIAVSLVASVNYLLLVPFAAFLVWLVVWRMPFASMERIFGLPACACSCSSSRVWQLGPDWGELLDAGRRTRTSRRRRRRSPTPTSASPCSARR